MPDTLLTLLCTKAVMLPSSLSLFLPLALSVPTSLISVIQIGDGIGETGTMRKSPQASSSGVNKHNLLNRVIWTTKKRITIHRTARKHTAKKQSKPWGVEPLSTNSRDTKRQKKLLASVQVVWSFNINVHNIWPEVMGHIQFEYIG